MAETTKSKMVTGAAELLSQRGVNGTSMRDVVRYTDTPRGSIGHHFPRGKLQMIEEAVVFAGKQVSNPLKRLTEDHGAIAGLRQFIALWREILESSNFKAGCPVLAVSVEHFVGERDGEPDESAQSGLLDIAHEVFSAWQNILTIALRREGVSPARARRLAVLVIASTEGTVALCRAKRSSGPLEDVRQELELVLTEALNGTHVA